VSPIPRCASAWALGCRTSTRWEAIAIGEAAKGELVRRVAAKKGRIPTFRSDQEERNFWAGHSVEEFAKELRDLDVEIRPPRTEQIALRLHKEDPVLEGWLTRSRGRTKAGRQRRVRRSARRVFRGPVSRSR
jgi:hypothetical protein